MSFLRTLLALESLVSTLQCLGLQGPQKKEKEKKKATAGESQTQLLLPNSHSQTHQNKADPGRHLWSNQGNRLGKIARYPIPGAFIKVKA